MRNNSTNRGRRNSPRETSGEPRRGSALVLVLVVIAMLTLAAYTFSDTMITEYRASTAYGQQLQATALAHSGVEYVAAFLGPDGGGGQADVYHNQALFHVPVSEDGGFTVVAPLEDVVVTSQSRGQGGQILRIGLVDESAKINLNALALLDPSDGVAREMLMALPYMNEVIADSILDWIDPDDEPRDYGMEFDGYTTVMPRNGPLESLEELLLIEGVTPALLYGEDSNRNGILDPNENDGEASLPWDNADDILDLGWVEYLTLYSKEKNLQHSPEVFGESRVNVNQELLTDLYDELEEKFDADVATFITAFRLHGPISEGLDSTSGSSGTGDNGQSGTGGSSGSSGGSTGSIGGGSAGGSGGRSGGGQSGGGGSSGGGSGVQGGGGQTGGNQSGSGQSGGGGQSGSGQSGGGAGQGTTQAAKQSTGLWRPSTTSSSSGSAMTTGDVATDQGLKDAADALAGALGGAQGSVTRGGLDLAAGSKRTIRSIYELIGAQVNATVNGQQVTLDSPWAADPGNLQMNLPTLLDQFTITDETDIRGRINVNEARLSVLMAIPSMPEDLPEKIIEVRSQRLSGATTADRFATAGWLLIEGLVDLPTMVELDSSITARGEVFRMQVVGHSDRGGTIARVEAVVDASSYAPKILYQRNLSRIGTGYRREDLPGFQTDRVGQ